ncbi:hypothetical protein SAY87_009813 [Trapa incisa]|uniref:Uncharacterized protein n=1 Tax=Trapa incisa TaxID=236973 RepID=A0AAN7JY95_9MYRT|nr:hypothetical protein SAY87_009813 [Trapa incisa]
MDNKKNGSSSSSSSFSSSSSSRSSPSDSLGYLFGSPKEQYYYSSSSSSPASSYSTGSSFGSIFPPPSSPVMGMRRDSSQCGIFMGSTRNQDCGNHYGIWDNYGGDGESFGQVFSMESKARGTQNYQHEISEPSYLSSSIYYGGQENYSPRTPTSDQPQHMFQFKKYERDDDEDSNGSNSESASRGNWWKGSLYY